MKQALSPRELAAAIGVSESSLKRWVDEGLIRATRTAGGHRRISLAEAIRFVRTSETPVARPDLLGLPGLEVLQEPMPARDDQQQRMLELLAEGESEQARAMATLMYLEGQSIADICDGPICFSMHRLGELWKSDARGIYVEHRAMDICAGIMNQLRMFLDIPADAPVAVGGAPSGDPYLLPSLMAATTLEDIGFRAINLGAETPADALQRAAVESRATLVWLSVSAVAHRDAIEASIRQLAESLDEAGISLIVGGRARASFSLPKVNHVHIGNSMAELSAFARGLQITLPRQSNQPSATNVN